MSETRGQIPNMPTGTARVTPLRDVKTIGEMLKHEEVVARFRQVMPKHLSPERMLRVMALAVAKTPKLRECNMMSLLGAMLGLGSLGLEPNTPLGHAYLIPFEKRGKVDGKWVTVDVEVQVVIGYRGYLDLMRRSGFVSSVHADVVYEGDDFSFEYGSNAHLRHVPRGARENRRPLWAYCHIKLTDGQAFEVLPYDQVLKTRDNSQGFLSAKRNAQNNPKAFDANPWVAFEHEMASKTMVRRIQKYVPLSIELANAMALDNGSEVGRFDLAALANTKEGDPISEVAMLGQDGPPMWSMDEFASDAEKEEVVVTQTQDPPRQEQQQQQAATEPTQSNRGSGTRRQSAAQDGGGRRKGAGDPPPAATPPADQGEPQQAQAAETQPETEARQDEGPVTTAENTPDNGTPADVNDNPQPDDPERGEEDLRAPQDAPFDPMGGLKFD
jgi:recombination protein RecT